MHIAAAPACCPCLLLACQLDLASLTSAAYLAAVSREQIEPIRADLPCRDVPCHAARYKKACVLEKLRRYEEALEVLTSLKTAAPKEPSVQLLLGKVYRKLGQDCEVRNAFFAPFVCINDRFTKTGSGQT